MREDNIMIADFIGMKPIVYEKDCVDNYENNWDWIMAVINKIESISDRYGTLYSVNIINKNQCEIVGECDSISSGGLSSINHSKISACYEAIVEFIKWYNENKDGYKEE